MFAAASCWLAVAALVGFVCSLKMHAPYLFTHCAWMSYGRLQPVASNLFLYGFGVQAGLALILWLVVRLGATTARESGVAFVGALFWNLGVVVGVAGVWNGDSTGFAWLEMPRYASPILLASYLVIGLAILAAFARRPAGDLYPSLWFALAALFWFPWIYATANTLLVFSPVRGALQTAIAQWYAGNLLNVWFVFVGLAGLLYLVPMRTGRPLPSRYSVMFTFWTLLLFGSLTGQTAGSPLPAWLPALSAVAAVVCVPGVLATLLCLREPLASAPTGAADPVLRLCRIALIAFAVVGLLGALGALRQMAPYTQLTWYGVGLAQLGILGLLGLVAVAVIIQGVPEWVPGGFPSAALTRVAQIAIPAGVLIQAGSLVAAGLLQGAGLQDGSLTFVQAHRKALMAFRLSTLGDLLLLVGAMALWANFKFMFWRLLRNACVPLWAGEGRASTLGVRS